MEQPDLGTSPAYKCSPAADVCTLASHLAVSDVYSDVTAEATQAFLEVHDQQQSAG